MKLFFLLLISCFLLSGCGYNNKPGETNMLFIDQGEELFPAENFVNDLKIIPLEVTENSIIRSIDKIETSDSLYYILDKRTNIIYLFNNYGKYIKNIDRKGGGGDEYVYIKDFCITNEQIIVLTIPSKLIFLDKETLGVIRNTKQLNKQYNQIILYNNELYLYSAHNGDIDQYNIEEDRLKNVLNYERLQGYIPDECSLFEYKNNMFAFITDKSTIYHLKKDSLNIYKELDYENKEEIISFFKKRDIAPLAPNEIGKYALPSSILMMDINDKPAYIYSYKGMIYINIEENNIRKTYYLGSNFPLIPSSLFYKEDKLISWSYLYYLLKNEDNSPLNIKLKKMIQENYNNYINDPETPLILIYELR